MADPRPLSRAEREGLRSIQRTAPLIDDSEIAVAVLAQALDTALDEIERLSGPDDGIGCCPCGHWIAAHYTGADVKTGCGLCPCPRSAAQADEAAPRGETAQEITSSVSEG